MATERHLFLALFVSTTYGCLLIGCQGGDGVIETNQTHQDLASLVKEEKEVLGDTPPPLLTLRGDCLSYSVNELAFSPDGKRLAAATGMATVNVWDLGTGVEVFALRGHSRTVFSVAFSSDGQHLASASEDHTAKLWDAGSGEELHTLKGHSEWVTSVAFSPDGRQLASASTDYMGKVWDVAGGHELLTLDGHTSYVQWIVFSPDGKRLASASADQTVKLWDANTGEELRTLKGHNSTVMHVTFSPDGNRLASDSVDGKVKVWDAVTGEELMTLNGFGAIFSPDGQRLASMTFKMVEVDSIKGMNGKTQIRECTHVFWDLATGQEIIAVKRGFGDWTLSPDWKLLANRSGQKLDLWEVTQP